MSQPRDESSCDLGPLPDYGEPDSESGLEPQDIDQIRWLLSLTPTERLRYAQRFASGAQKLQLARRA
jgi:hypothetical protein